MMMRIDDRQLRFEDRLLLLFCEPRIVGFAAMTKPAWLDGLRHRDVPIFAEIARICRVRNGHRLAFDVRSKAFTRDSRVHAARSDAPGGSTGQAVLSSRVMPASLRRNRVHTPTELEMVLSGHERLGRLRTRSTARRAA